MDMFVGTAAFFSLETGAHGLQGHHALPLRRLCELFANDQSRQRGEHAEGADPMYLRAVCRANR